MEEKLQAAVIVDLKALSSATETVVNHEEFRAAQQKKAKSPVKQTPRKVNVAQTDFGF
jgi:hypothetical protein